MRALLQLVLLGALAEPAGAQSLEVFGYAGLLGEWELSASVIKSDETMDFSGPLTMTHVGICSVDGPEEKKGKILFRLSESSSRIAATISVDGATCSYRGQMSDSFTGVMNCPNRPAVPLKLWLKK